MNANALLPLLYNAALLVATAVVFDTAPTRDQAHTRSLRMQLGHGLALAAVAAVAMLTPWTLVPGVVFDARSVVIGLSALFFGTVTTTVVVVIAALVRVSQGGAGALPAVAAMIGVTVVGLVWRHQLRLDQADLGPVRLFVFGFTAHVAVLLAMLLLPWPTALAVLRAVAVPMLIVMPTATMLIGLLFVRRLRRERTQRALAQTLEQRKVLHRELQHRVKNSMSMIVAMITLQRENYQNEETRDALTELHGRVTVLAKLYGLLFQGTIQDKGTASADRVQVRPLLNAVCESLGSSLGNGSFPVHSSIDDIEIDTGRASSIGIIANELTTNALKHAFPVPAGSETTHHGSQAAVKQTGSVAVSFTQSNGRYTLEVRDNGVGLPEGFTPQSAAGFGLGLVQMLTEQLNGTLTVESSSDAAATAGAAAAAAAAPAPTTGSVFRVVFPA